jgi:hypothetical protein
VQHPAVERCVSDHHRHRKKGLASLKQQVLPSQIVFLSIDRIDVTLKEELSSVGWFEVENKQSVISTFRI